MFLEPITYHGLTRIGENLSAAIIQVILLQDFVTDTSKKFLIP